MIRRISMTITIVALGATLVAAATSVPRDDVRDIVKWERDALRADLAGDADYYARNLSEQWTDGMSDGTFQTKRSLLDDLRDPKRNSTTNESLADIRVRLFGGVAVATYRETYDALVHGRRVKKTIITTDTFLKRSGKWIQIAAHSSAVANMNR